MPFNTNDHQLLERICKVMPNAVYIFDVEACNLAWCNDVTKNIYGYTLPELQDFGSQLWNHLIHPDDIPKLQSALKRTQNLLDNESFDLEYRIITKQGQSLWVSDRITIFARNTAGQVLSYLGVSTSIEGRNASEEGLKKMNEKLSLSLQAAQMGTWEWDYETNTAQWDARMLEIHGAKMEPGLTPRSVLMAMVIPEDHTHARTQLVDAKAKEALSAHAVYRIRMPDNTLHHIRSFGRFLEGSDRNKMYGVAWDATEEIMAQQQVEEAHAKLIASTKMAALGEMSGGIAHEINNPLTVIQGRAFQLIQLLEAHRLQPEKVKEISESISRTADKIARIIKSMRAFTREGSKDPFNLISVREIIDNTLDFCRARFYNHGIEIHVEEISDELEVECRIVQIEQVLLNLLNNSFDAVQTVEKKWIRIEVSSDDNQVLIRIIDSGPGVSQDQISKIMSPFYTTKEFGKGTGLGLSISADIMKAHKGELLLEKASEPTTFTMRLPRLQEEI